MQFYSDCIRDIIVICGDLCLGVSKRQRQVYLACNIYCCYKSPRGNIIKLSCATVDSRIINSCGHDRLLTTLRPHKLHRDNPLSSMLHKQLRVCTSCCNGVFYGAIAGMIFGHMCELVY
jgi:hypothetical protein